MCLREASQKERLASTTPGVCLVAGKRGVVSILKKKAGLHAAKSLERRLCHCGTGLGACRQQARLA